MKMEDQGKRLLLAVAIAFGIMMVWTCVFPPQAGKPRRSRRRRGDRAGRRAGRLRRRPRRRPPRRRRRSTPGARRGRPWRAAPRRAPAAGRCRCAGPSKTFTCRYDVSATFSSCGGPLKSWQLLGDQFHEPGDESVPEDLVEHGGSTGCIPSDPLRRRLHVSRCRHGRVEGREDRRARGHVHLGVARPQGGEALPIDPPAITSLELDGRRTR